MSRYNLDDDDRSPGAARVTDARMSEMSMSMFGEAALSTGGVVEGLDVSRANGILYTIAGQ